MLARRPLAVLGCLALVAAVAACDAPGASSEGAGAADATSAPPDTSTSPPFTPADTSGGQGAYADAAPGPWPGGVGDWDDEAAEPPGPGDKYEAVGTNPFVTVAHDPLSTFSVDVDTASYDIFRRDVQSYGTLPAPDAVRLEEYVNAFTYADEAPAWDAPLPLHLTLEAAPSPFAPTTLLRVGLRGRVLPEDFAPRMNLVFLVDVSGSMSSSDKLPLVKVVLRELVKVLPPDATISLVTYASSVGVVLPPTAAKNAQTIVDAIDALGAGGSTSGGAGMQLAYQQAEAGFVPGGINHVFLCTDGDFNVGVTSDDGLVAFIESKLATGITLTALGFGSGNLNDSMMEKVSNAGNGIYMVISSEDQAIAYVNGGRIWQSLFIIAKDVKLQVELNPAHVYAYRLLGYENRSLTTEEWVDVTTDAGEVGAGHSVTALYELVLAGGEVPMPEGAPALVDGPLVEEEVPGCAPTALAEVRVRYKAPDAAPEDVPEEIARDLAVTDVAPSAEAASADLSFAAAVAALAEILKGSPYGDVANLPAIRATVAALASLDPERAELSALLDLAAPLILAAP